MVATATTLPAQQQPTTVRTVTAGVLVDVTVVDKDGHPVTDLTASDFEVSEDGKAQQIISATLMRNGVPARIAAGASPRASSSQPATSAPAGTLGAPPPPIPTVTAILFDSLSADARPFAVKAAAQFVSSMALPTEYGGVFQSGLSLNTVQPFTNRTADLRAAIDRVAITPTSNLSVDEERKRASLRTQGLDPATPVTGGAEYGQGWTTVAEREQRLYGGGGDPSENLLTQMALRMEDGYKHFLSEYEGDGALSGLRSAVTEMAPLPGRKSILYFTEELPITSRLKSKFDALIGEANRANISVYTVDAAGLRVHSKEQEVGQGVKLSGDQGLGDARRSDGGWTKDLEQQEQNLTSRPAAVLSRLANETGGFMIDNTNDLGKGVARMQVERTTYYLLGYQPTNAAADGKFRKLSVKVKRSKYTVRARPGYVAPSR
jgi:VWFA-related protein